MMTFEAFQTSSAVRALLGSMGNVTPQFADGDAEEHAFAWLLALEISSTYAGFRKLIIHLNTPYQGRWVDAIKRRAGTASTGEFWLLMGLAMLTDFGHVANALTRANIKRRTGPWSGMYASLDAEAALAACVYHSATA